MKGASLRHAQSKNYFCRDQQKIFQVQCGLGRIEDQLPPPCSPARRPRSASICRYFNFIFQRILLHWWFIFHIGVSFFFFLSVSLPDTKQIVQESLGQVRIRIIVVVGVDVERNQIIFIFNNFFLKEISSYLGPTHNTFWISLFCDCRPRKRARLS